MAENKKDIMKSAIDKVKLVDAGIKNKYGIDCCSPVKASKPEERIYYPSIHLSSKEAPMLEGKEVGKEVTLVLKAVVVSHSMNEGMESQKRENFTLEIRKIGTLDSKK